MQVGVRRAVDQGLSRCSLWSFCLPRLFASACRPLAEASPAAEARGYGPVEAVAEKSSGRNGADPSASSSGCTPSQQWQGAAPSGSPQPPRVSPRMSFGTPTRNVLSGRATYLGIPRPPVCLISRQSRALHRPTSAASWIIGGTPSPDEK